MLAISVILIALIIAGTTITLSYMDIHRDDIESWQYKKIMKEIEQIKIELSQINRKE